MSIPIDQITYPGSYPAWTDNIFYLSFIIWGIVLLLSVILLILNGVSWIKTEFLLRNINKIHRVFIVLNGLFLIMIVLYFPVKYFNDLFNETYQPLSYREVDLTYGGLIALLTLVICIVSAVSIIGNLIVYSKRKMDYRNKLCYQKIIRMWIITFSVFTLLTVTVNALFFHYFYFPLLEKRPY